MTLLTHLPLNGHARDLVSNHHGTWTGLEAYANETPVGDMSQSANLDGASRINMAVEGPFDFDIADAFSVGFSIRAPTITALVGLIVKSLGFVNEIGWKVITGSTGRLAFRVANGSASWIISISVPEIDDNKWHQVLCTKGAVANRDQMKIYFDGVLVGTGTSLAITGSLLNNETVAIGALSGGGDEFTGKIKDVKIWDTELVLADAVQLTKVMFNRWGVGVSDGDDL